MGIHALFVDVCGGGGGGENENRHGRQGQGKDSDMLILLAPPFVFAGLFTHSPLCSCAVVFIG